MAARKLNTLSKYYITLILILGSGTIYASYIYNRQFPFILVISAIFFTKLSKIRRDELIKFLFICVIVLLNYFVYPENIYGVIGLIIKLFAVLLICNSINIRDLYQSYVNIMFIIAIISLICFSTWIINPSLIMSLVPATEVWGNPIRVTPIYTFPYMGINRNFGPFHEAGMYQVFINIALFIVLKFHIKNKPIVSGVYVIIFMITIITTFSTSGLITTGIILIYFILINAKAVFNNKLVIIISLILMATIFWANNEYGIIGDKLNSSNESFSARTSEFAITSKVLGEHPFLGVGFQNGKYNSEFGNITNGTNGILALFQQFGIPFGIILFSFFLWGIRNLSAHFLEICVIASIIFISYSTEPTMFQPIFLITLFYKPIRDRGEEFLV